MKHTHTVMAADGLTPIHILQCEHCGAGNQTYRPVKYELLELTNCSVCKVNSRGERDDFDIKDLKV